MSIQTYEIVDEFESLSALSFDDTVLLIGSYIGELEAHEALEQAREEAEFVGRIRCLHPNVKLNLRTRLARLH